MSSDESPNLGACLAANLKYLRNQNNLTQAQLARRAGIPRSTVATLETGFGNPTLTVLTALTDGLRVRLDELLGAQRARVNHFPRASIETVRRDRGRVTVWKLLPEPVAGMEIDRMCLRSGARLKGVPHRPGTREYLSCEQGQITLWVAGGRVDLKTGDVAAFDGDQRHSYSNEGTAEAVGFSVVNFGTQR